METPTPIEKKHLFVEMINKLKSGKFIYHERRIMLVKLLAFDFDDKGFKAKIERIHILKKKRDFPQWPNDLIKWEFSGSWEFPYLWVSPGQASMTYANWSVWFDTELISAVEKLIALDDDLEALEYIHSFGKAS